jgi:hypothetical protein
MKNIDEISTMMEFRRKEPMLHCLVRGEAEDSEGVREGREREGEVKRDIGDALN